MQAQDFIKGKLSWGFASIEQKSQRWMCMLFYVYVKMDLKLLYKALLIWTKIGKRRKTSRQRYLQVAAWYFATEQEAKWGVHKMWASEVFDSASPFGSDVFVERYLGGWCKKRTRSRRIGTLADSISDKQSANQSVLRSKCRLVCICWCHQEWSDAIVRGFKNRECSSWKWLLQLVRLLNVKRAKRWWEN